VGLFYRKTVKDCILDQFAGPPDTGVFSPSVQNTLYLAERMILDKVEQVGIDHSQCFLAPKLIPVNVL
jgi:hypothetical protein